MHYVKILIRLIRCGPQLIQEIEDVLVICGDTIDENRRAFLRGQMTLTQVAQSLDHMAKEINDVVELVAKVLK